VIRKSLIENRSIFLGNAILKDYFKIDTVSHRLGHFLPAVAKVHVAGDVTVVGMTFRAGKLFFASVLLKAATSDARSAFHAAVVELNSRQLDSQVWINAGVGGISIPF